MATDANHFSATLNYSSSNEDTRSEFRALGLGPRDAVLCITGSGARVLDLLTRRPRNIVAVDCNPAQNHLLRLKIAAIKRLEYPDLLAFLGIIPSDRRRNLYETVRGELPESGRRFWDARHAKIHGGVIYAGRWENHFHLLAQTVGLLRKRLRRRLFESGSISEQESVWREWSRGAWPVFLRLATADPMWRYVLRDPGFYRFVPTNFSVADYLRCRLSESMRGLLLRDSHFAWLLFFGRYNASGPLPDYLQPANFDFLREDVQRIYVADGRIQDILAIARDRFTAYSLSDIASYTSESEYARLWRGILATAPRGARVCERQFLVKRAPPHVAANRLERDCELEAALAREDGSIFYTFITGSLST
jgi:S-adenosylmethionine-diacylglycerol 3-amino-3-carboxypropyl transferase